MKNRSFSVSYGNGLVAINRIFYYRISIPRKHRCKIGISEFKISLKTAYLEKARASVRRLAARAQYIFDALDGGYWKNMNHELIKKLALKYLKEKLQLDEEDRASKGKRSLEKADYMQEIMSSCMIDEYEALVTNDCNRVKSEADDLIQEAEAAGWDVEELKCEEDSHNALCRELLKARIEMCKIIIAREDGKYDDFSDMARNSLISPANVDTAPPVDETAFPLLEEAKTIYIDENATAVRGKASWSQGTLTQHRGSLHMLSFVLGNIRLNRIDADAVKKYKDYMHLAPSNASKKPKYRNKNYEQMIKMEIPEEDRMSDQTLKDHFIRINKFLNWANMRYGLSIPHNDILQIRLRINPQMQREDYTREELSRFFNAPAYTETLHSKAAYFWMPLLGIFTGARLEELCQLYVNDFKQTQNGLWYIDINDDGEDKQLKNYNARRTVPLHETLIDLGLIKRVEYLKANGFERLFPELKKTPTRPKYGADVSRWFTGFRCSVDIGDSTSSKKNFHSFRHTFINYFKQLGYENTEAWATLEEIVGHSRGRSQTSSRYAKGLNPDIEYYSARSPRVASMRAMSVQK